MEGGRVNNVLSAKSFCSELYIKGDDPAERGVVFLLLLFSADRPVVLIARVTLFAERRYSKAVGALAVLVITFWVEVQPPITERTLIIKTYIL